MAQQEFEAWLNDLAESAAGAHIRERDTKNYHAETVLPNWIVPREKWSNVAPNLDQLDRNTRSYNTITLHHTGKWKRPRGVELLHRDKVERVRRRIGAKFNAAQVYDAYGDVGYHFLIDDNGDVYEARSLAYKGGHAGEHNDGNIGISFTGNYSERELNASQVEALDRLMNFLFEQYPTIDTLKTHGDYNAAKSDELAAAEDQIDNLTTVWKNRHTERDLRR